ncbi:cytochrome c1 [Scophthalmus maximus]|uniref:cytochrome c1 n=1 Tax=Scophthalmus maximus TaxID=52904 RepID=UPI0015E143C3|nr:cytochrome c1 [Scophthalmus maximus]
MGCSTSSQTSAVETTRPSAKPGESNGTSTTGAANENGNVAEDSETLLDQTPAATGDDKPSDEPAAAGEEPQPAAASPPAEAEAADSSAETEQEKAEATATDSEPKTEAEPAPSE